MSYDIHLDDDAAMGLLKALGESAGDGVTLRYTPAWTERVFKPGDRVRVPFDDGMGSATVTGTGIDSLGHHYVKVSYGPGGRYSTSLGRGSVETDNVIEHPAVVEVFP